MSICNISKRHESVISCLSDGINKHVCFENVPHLKIKWLQIIKIYKIVLMKIKILIIDMDSYVILGLMTSISSKQYTELLHYSLNYCITWIYFMSTVTLSMNSLITHEN